MPYLALIVVNEAIRENVMRWYQGINRWRDLRDCLLAANFPMSELSAERQAAPVAQAA
ncbi:MAG: hypothetical protein U1E70_12250 [Acetobacteraceae bacterium]